MKIFHQNFVLSLVLVILLLLTSACQTDSDEPVSDEISATPIEQATVSISEEGTEQSHSESDSEVAAVESTKATSTPEATATRAPQTTQATEGIDSESATVPPQATEPAEATKTADPTVEANIRPTITPQVRTDWRAAGGDFIVRYENGIKIFDYYIIISEEWWEVFEIRQESETHVSFWYTGKPEQKEEVFSITAYRGDQWEERKNNGDQAKEILWKRDTVFVYEIVDGNPFSGEDAEKFDELKGTVPGIIADTFEIETRKSTD